MGMNGNSAFRIPPSSSRYNRYEARMKTIRRHLDFWYLYVLAAGALVALILFFLSRIGSFSGDIACSDFVYGDAPNASVKVFLSKVSWEYAPENSSQWSSDYPTQTGTYRIRAVTRNGFGQPVYSNEVTVAIKPRELTAQVEGIAYVYGEFDHSMLENQTKFTGLAPNDRAEQLDFHFAEAKNGDITACLVYLRIFNQNHVDVTACYVVNTQPGTFTMTPRPITVTAEDGEKVYDGLPWESSAPKLTAGTMAGQDQLHVYMPVAPADAGVHLLTPQCTVLDAAGKDITAFYDITLVS